MCIRDRFEEKPIVANSNTISCGIYVIRRRQLIELIEKAAEEGQYDFVKDILIRYKNLKRIYGYKIQDYWKNIATVDDYFNANMDFLKPDIRDYFFRQYPDCLLYTSELSDTDRHQRNARQNNNYLHVIRNPAGNGYRSYFIDRWYFERYRR